MPARHEQRDERKRGRLRFEHRGKEMAFHVMDRERRHVPCVGDAPAERRADEQRPHQPGSGGIGHAVDVRGPGARLVEHAAHQSRQPSNVVARSELGHHASELGVNRNLRVHGVREQTVLGVANRYTGLVAGGFDSQNPHPRASIPETGCLEFKLTPLRHPAMYAPFWRA